MSALPISMRKLKDVLRLKYEAGLSQRQIARALRLSLGVVNKYLNAAQAAGITWPLPETLSEAQLRRELFPPESPSPQAAYAQPDFAAIHRELQRGQGVTRQLLWEEYVEANPENHYQYTQFCLYYRQWRDRLKLSMRQTHRAGEKMFVDYAGQTVPITDLTTGEVHQAQIFVAVLGASNYTFAEATFSQKLHDWIGSHVRALEFFGGVVQLVIPDNLKSGVTRADRYEPVLNRSYQEMLAHYSTAALPARPRKPKDKPKVEVAVQVVERWILARLRHQTFFSLADLNRALGGLLVDLNHRPFKKLPGTRRSQYEALDLPALRPLPAQPYQFAEWKLSRVHVDYHVEIDGHYYSVPHALATRQVEARVTATTVELFHQNQRVASHARAAEGRGGHTTVPEHMPSHHRAHSEWNPGRFLNWAIEIGPNTRDFVRELLESRKHPELSYRACLGLLNLAKRYTPERLEAACHRALAIGALRQSSVRTILERGLDSQPLPDPDTEAAVTLPVHENVRGAAYYQ
ncbi:MAG: IS21 family transposase ISPpu7 [Gammaproteobacteria bacterium]|nr:IS21 family transposase ISPpu7 [Gammaproteobacteria bacterium]